MPHKWPRLATQISASAVFALAATHIAHGAERYSVAIIFEDVATTPGPVSRADVAAYAANSLTRQQCRDLADHINNLGGFARCFQEQ